MQNMHNMDSQSERILVTSCVPQIQPKDVSHENLPWNRMNYDARRATTAVPIFSKK